MAMVRKLVERIVLRCSNMVMAQNHDNLEFILRQGVDRNKTVITRIGRLLDKLHFITPSKRESGFPDLKALGVTNEIVLMGIFRLEPVKLPDHLVKVVAIMQKRGYNVKGLLVGDGSMSEKLVSFPKNWVWLIEFLLR